MSKLNIFLRNLLLGFSFAIVGASALAQNFPNAPVKIVVPFPPGGTTDILARILANELTKKWSQSVVVENKAGASGTVFSEQLVKMSPDG